MVMAAVIDEAYFAGASRYFRAVERRPHDAAVHPVRVLHHDAVARCAVLVGDLETGPSARDAGLDDEDAAAQTDAQYCLHGGAVHPTGGTRVPGPAAAPDMLGSGIDIGAYDVGLDLVSMNARASAGVIDGIDDGEDLCRPVAVAQERKGEHRPQGCVRVLTAIFPQSGRIGLDVAGVVQRVIEGRRE